MGMGMISGRLWREKLMWISEGLVVDRLSE